MKSRVRKTELIGIIVISLVGGALHFVFELSGESPPVGVFAAVNESVFEHLKLTFWPTVLYGAATYKLLRASASNFIIGKAAAEYVMPVTIIVLFYAYTILTGIESLAVDIIIFVIAVVVGQVVSYKIMTAGELHPWVHWLSGVLIVALVLIYGLFTFYPPHVPFFENPVEGGYGIPQ